jgi:hypothetical protein
MTTKTVGENPFDELARALRLAQGKGDRPKGWRLSNAMYDRVRDAARGMWMTAMVTGDRSLLGLPYNVIAGQEEPFILVVSTRRGLRADQPFVPNWDEPGEHFIAAEEED